MRLLNFGLGILAVLAAMPVYAFSPAVLNNELLLQEINQTDGKRRLEILAGRQVKLNVKPQRTGNWYLEKDQGVFVECSGKMSGFHRGAVFGTVKSVMPSETGYLVTLDRCAKTENRQENR